MVIIAVVVMCLLGIGIYRAQKIPFLINKNLSMSVTNLKLYTFQPIYLWAYEKNGGVFVKSLYIGKWNMPYLATLWISGDYLGKRLEPVPYAKDGKKAGELGDVVAVMQRYKFGNRIRVEYVTGEVVPGLTSVVDERFCEQSPRVCQLNEIVKNGAGKYARMPFVLPVPVLAIMAELEL